MFQRIAALVLAQTMKVVIASHDSRIAIVGLVRKQPVEITGDWRRIHKAAEIEIDKRPGAADAKWVDRLQRQPAGLKESTFACRHIEIEALLAQLDEVGQRFARTRKIYL